MSLFPRQHPYLALPPTTYHLYPSLTRLPPPLSWLYAGWMAFSHILGMIMSKIFLTLLWIVGFGIYAIALKIFHLVKRKPSKLSYWEIPPEEFEGRLKYQF